MMFSLPAPAKRVVRRSTTKPIAGHVQGAMNVFNQRNESLGYSKSRKSESYQRSSTKPVVGIVNSIKNKFEEKS